MILGRSARLLDLSAELRALVHEHGISLLSQPNLLDSLLKDTHPQCVQEALILRAAAQLIGPSLHMQASPQELDALARRLGQEGHLKPSAARWAVQMLAQSIGLEPPSHWRREEGEELPGRGKMMALVGAAVFGMATLCFYVGYKTGVGQHVNPPPSVPVLEGASDRPFFAPPKLQAIDPDELPDQPPPSSESTSQAAQDEDESRSPPKRILVTRTAPVRPQPSPDAGPAVCTLMAGDRVTVLDVVLDDTGKGRDRWYQVPCDQKRVGWVSRNFLAGE